jgi:uncharacterized protein involved in outer membrane biogenesis
MRKWIIVFGIVILVAVGALALIAVNINSYLNENRDWVSEQAESALGRSVSFGKARISLLGGLALRVADLRIGEDPAFSKEPFVSADAIDLRVAVLPALFGKIEVGRAVLRSPTITVIQTAKGLSTDSLGGGGKAAKAAKTAEGADEEGGLPAFAIASVDISDGTLRFIDKTAKPPSEQSVEKLDFRATNVSLTGPVGFDVKAAVLGASRQNVRVIGQLEDLENPKASFTLTSSELELAPGKGDALRDVEVKGTLSLPKAGPRVQAKLHSPGGTIAGADYSDLAADFKMQQRIASVEKFTASVFDGEISATGRYDMRKASRPSFDLKSTLAGMRMEQLVASRAPRSAGSIEGELGGQLGLTGAGAGWEQIKQSLRGKGGIQLVDGVLRDVNLADSTLKGVTGVPGLSNLLPPKLRKEYPEAFGVSDTVFENMDTKIDIRDGWAYFRDFRLAARDYAVTGQGRCSLDNKLDMSTVMVFSEPLSNSLVDAAKPMRYLRGAEGRVEIPVKLVGSLPGIKPVPDAGYIAKAASRQAVGKLLQDALGGKKEAEDAEDADGSAEAPSTEDAAADLLKGLGGLFGK